MYINIYIIYIYYIKYNYNTSNETCKLYNELIYKKKKKKRKNYSFILKLAILETIIYNFEIKPNYITF